MTIINHPHVVYTPSYVDAHKMFESVTSDLAKKRSPGGVEFHAHPYSQFCPGILDGPRSVENCWRADK